MTLVPASSHASASSSVATSPYLSNFGPTTIVIPVTLYGAKFDNLTDDSAAIQAALDAAAFTFGGLTGNDKPACIVQLPSGLAKLGTPLSLHANVVLRGQGPASTYLYPTYTTALPTIQLATGAEVQCEIRDLGIVINSANPYGIDLVQTGGASILSDSRHIVENVVVVGGCAAVRAFGGTENRYRNISAYRQTVLSSGVPAAIYLNGTDSMIEDCTVAGPIRDLGAGGGSGIRLNESNSRMVNCKVFGPAGGSDLTAGIYLIGQRNQVIGCEVQDFPGFGLQDDQGHNTYHGLVIDSCKGQAIYAQGPIQMRGGLFVNRGGAWTMPAVFFGGGVAGNDIEGEIISVAAVYSSTRAAGQRIKLSAANSSEFPIQNSGALPTVSPASGVGLQVSTTRDTTLNVATATAGSVTVALSPDGTTYSTVQARTLAATDSVVQPVPCGWYVKLTLVTSTISAAVYY